MSYYLDLEYPFQVTADPDGGYVIAFPDLPGCLTQVETAEEIGPMAEEARRLWIATEYEDGDEIPPPSYPHEYSGRFNIRIPRSLHRRLAELADREAVSLNQCVVSLLASAEAQSRSEWPATKKRVSRKTRDHQVDDFDAAVRAHDRAVQRSRLAKKLSSGTP